MFLSRIEMQWFPGFRLSNLRWVSESYLGILFHIPLMLIGEILFSWWRWPLFGGVLPNFALTFFLQIQIVILSFLTNIICDHLHEDSSDGDLQQLFSELFTNDGGIFTFCLSFPTVRVFLAPPNVRMKPAWYSRMRPSIIRTFHQFLQSGPATLQGIEDFSGDFERDQVHYTILSGIYFVQHLADRVSAMLVEPVPSKSIRWYFWLCVLTV